LKDTYDFVNKVSDLDVKVDNYMVSFDVESLFTNVPTSETIELILELAYPSNDKSFLFHDLGKKAMRKLLIFCTQESHFQFNGFYYDQIDGVAMGSPLGPLFANVFMSEFERKHMAKLKELGVIKCYQPHAVEPFLLIRAMVACYQPHAVESSRCFKFFWSFAFLIS
jgi:hypothetical protein